MSQKDFYGLYALLIPFAILLVAILVDAGQPTPGAALQTVSGGDPALGVAAIQQYGCGSCHTIPGVDGANGQVGPVLVNLSRRAYIAGKLQNTPQNLIHWIRFPQEVSPGVDMPDVGVTDQAAKDIAAYLYQLN